MGKSVNKVIILGNVGKDPAMKTTQSGTTIANFSIATSDRIKDSQGNWTDKTEWINCIAFGKTAEIIRDYITKGSKLYVEGKLQTSSWDDKESGQKRYKTEVVVFDVTLLSPKQESSPVSSSSNYERQDDHISGEDIPF